MREDTAIVSFPADRPELDAAKSAEAVGLCYATDDLPGIQRQRCGRGFRYLHPDQRPVRERQAIDRIRSLAFPPAWTDVWICPVANGHLQATGRDSRGRKQYLYHRQWREIREEMKYEHLIAFAEALPRIRCRVATDLAERGLPRIRSWPPSSVCWKPRWCALATTNTPARMLPSA